MSDIYPITLARYNDWEKAGLTDENQIYQIYDTDEDIAKELIHTRKTLEQSETCCTEWEKQALDYKAENIALSGDLERTRKALDVAVDALKTVKRYLCEMPAPDGATVLRMACESATTVKKALEQITALEQKDK